MTSRRFLGRYPMLPLRWAALACAGLVVVGFTLCRGQTGQPVAPRSSDEVGFDPAQGLVVTAPPAAPATTAATTSTMLANQLDRLKVAHPFTSELPHDEAHFHVDYRAAGGGVVLEITLKVIVNRADQLPQARLDLTAYRAEALSFLAAHLVGPSTYPIEWNPDAL